MKWIVPMAALLALICWPPVANAYDHQDDDGWAHWMLVPTCDVQLGDITVVDIMMYTESAPGGDLDSTLFEGVAVTDSLEWEDPEMIPNGGGRWYRWRADQNGVKGEWAPETPRVGYTYGGSSGCASMRWLGF